MYVQLEGEKIPIITIGTSPFIGAGQFGSNAAIWRNKFLENTKEMSNLMRIANEHGAKGAEIIPIGKIPLAAQYMIEKYPDFSILGSTSWDELRIDLLAELKTKIVFLHGTFSDRRNKEFLERFISKIRKFGMIPGVATHEPLKTIPFILDLKLDCPAILLPFNSEGYLMGDKLKLEQLVDATGEKIFFVGMKTLAAGKIKPEDAYNYIEKHNISAITVGFVSETEILETVPIALKHLKRDKN